MSWGELRHTQDRAREARNRELSALKKKADELKQKLLRSNLCKEQQKNIESKPKAKKMPLRKNACDSAPANVSLARASAPAEVCPWKQYALHVCAPDCVNWKACPSTGEPMRINQIDCVQGYGNTSSDEDVD